jgi:NADPH-dependent curcumin reductase CurA
MWQFLQEPVATLEDNLEGIENCPHTLNRLFTGENKGKQLLKI